MASERPEYNAKIKMMHALAPVAYTKNAVSPVFRIADLLRGPLYVRDWFIHCQFVGSMCFRSSIYIIHLTLQKAIEFLGAYEFLPPLYFFKLMGQQVCRDTSPLIAVCESILFLITGFNERNLNAVRFDLHVNQF